MKFSSKTIKNFVSEKNRKVVFTPGPGSLLEENINGLGPIDKIKSAINYLIFGGDLN